WASTLVPARRRVEWRKEWEGEAAYAWSRAAQRGGGRFRALRLRARVASCIIDALWVGRQEMDGSGWIQDVRLAVRSLGRHPMFTTITVVTLALGIGANTAVFTLIDGVLLSPLPFERSEELVDIGHMGRDAGDDLPMSPGLFVLYREQARSLEDIALYRAVAVNLVAEGEPERVQAQSVTPGFFDLLGAEPMLGRTFTEREGEPGGEEVVVIAEGLWKAAFGEDPGVVGRPLDVDG